MYERIKKFLFYLCNKFDDWNFKRDILKMAIFLGKEKEVKGFIDSYPEILNNLSDSDACEIMSFCNNEPVLFKKDKILLLGLGTVGYYLNDSEFEKYKTRAITLIIEWINKENSVVSIGDYIFSFLSECCLRISQDELCDIGCMFMEKHFVRWYRELFKFMSQYIKLNELSDGRNKKLLNYVCAILNNEEEIQLVKDAPSFIYMLRKQDSIITEEMDRLVCEKIPNFYDKIYKLETTECPKEEMPEFIQEYVLYIEDNNIKQGQNGTYFDHGTREISTIRNIITQEEIKYERDLFGSIISVVSNTLLMSKEGINAKIDAVSLLTCILVMYPEAIENDGEIFDRIYDNQNNIEANGVDFMSSNIDEIALKVSLQFMFSFMGKNVETQIMELMPFVKNSVET